MVNAKLVVETTGDVEDNKLYAWQVEQYLAQDAKFSLLINYLNYRRNNVVDGVSTYENDTVYFNMNALQCFIDDEAGYPNNCFDVFIIEGLGWGDDEDKWEQGNFYKDFNKALVEITEISEVDGYTPTRITGHSFAD